MNEQPTTDSGDVMARMESFFGAPSEVAPADEPQAEDTLQGADTVSGDDSQEGAEDTQPGGEEFDLDGVKYVLPKELANKVAEWRKGHMQEADYTRKSQEVADLNRQAQIQYETLKQANEFEKSISTEKGELERVKYQLSQFKGIDWSALDMQQAWGLRSQMETLKDRSTELEKTIGEKYQQFNNWTESQKSELIKVGQQYLQKTIKGWGPEAIKDVAASAKEVGYSDAELNDVRDPRFVRLAWKAAQFDKLQSGKPAAIAAVQKAPPVIKPGASGGQAVMKQKQYVDARQALKKSGSVRDAAALFERFVK